MFVEDMKVSFNTVDDLMPSGRSKLIHSVGVHALGKLTWDHALPYTGLFKTGAHNMVIRLSSAADPKLLKAVGAGVTLKVFRDNVASANSFFLHSFNDKGWNFFNYPLQNHVSSAVGSPVHPGRLLLKKFEEASDYPFYTGLSDWAKIDDKGHHSQQIKFPFQLILVPNPSLKTAGAKQHQTSLPFTNQFSAIQPGTLLYTVYIQDAPFSQPFVAGKLTLNNDETGRLTTSSYGDNTLFFRHQKFEDDFVYHPEWKTTCPKRETCNWMFDEHH